MKSTLDDQLSKVLHLAVADMKDALSPPAGPPAEALPDAAFRWEIPKDPSFGDLSSSIGFKIAAQRKQPAPLVARSVADAFLSCCSKATNIAHMVEKVDVKGGYLNLFLSHEALIGVVREVLRRRSRYGASRAERGCCVNIEFVSANPTGPLSVAHGRQAAVGDVLAKLLRSQGCRVTTEYYLNDEGRQIEMLGRSLRARCAELLGHSEAIPEDGYYGSYLCDVARACVRRYGRRFLEGPEKQVLRRCMQFGMARLQGKIQGDLAHFGLKFSRWSSQRRLRTSGRIKVAMDTLRRHEALYESEGALWFASTKYGDDKDRVVRKSDGELTYLAPDMAYHQWKFERGYNQILNLWGPDHHGYIPRLKAAVKALGLPADRLIIRIVQLVTLSRRGRPVPMSKRQGEFVTFREVMDEVGVDATRFFFLMRTMESHLDFDLELAKSKSQDNPVYYVQYAHARICSILAKTPASVLKVRRPKLELLKEPEERLLMRVFFQYPLVLRICAASLEPHGVTTYLRRLAETFHVFYTKHRVLSGDRTLSAARLSLVRTTKQVLANGLDILGISAPKRM